MDSELFTTPMVENIVAENAGKIVPFFGSAVSLFSPTSLPDWSGFIQQLIFSLGQAAEIGLPLYTEDVLPPNVGFEIASEIVAALKSGGLPEYKVTEILARRLGQNYLSVLRSFSQVSPNPIHEWAAAKLMDGTFPALMTTNFDRAIEIATIQLGGNVLFLTGNEPVDRDALEQFSSVVSLENRGLIVVGSFDAFYIARQLLPLMGVSSYSFLFKIHGDAGNPKSCVDTELQRTQGFPSQVTATLTAVIHQFSLFFMGYSGTDMSSNLNYLRLDSERDLARVFWLVREGDKPPVYSEMRPDVVQLVSGSFRGNIEWGKLNPDILERFKAWADKEIGAFWTCLVLADLADALSSGSSGDVCNNAVKLAILALNFSEQALLIAFNGSEYYKLGSLPLIQSAYQIQSAMNGGIAQSLASIESEVMSSMFFRSLVVSVRSNVTSDTNNQIVIAKLCHTAYNAITGGNLEQALNLSESAILELRNRFKDFRTFPDAYIPFAIYATVLRSLGFKEEAIVFMSDACNVARLVGNQVGLDILEELVESESHTQSYDSLKSETFKMLPVDFNEVIVSDPLFDNVADLPMGIPAWMLFAAHLNRALTVGDRVAIGPNFLLNSRIFVHETLFRNSESTKITLQFIRPLIPTSQKVRQKQGDAFVDVLLDLWNHENPILTNRNEYHIKNVSFLHEEVSDEFILLMNNFYKQHPQLIFWYDFLTISNNYGSSVLKLLNSPDTVRSFPSHLQEAADEVVGPLAEFVTLCCSPTKTGEKRNLYRSQLYKYGNLFTKSTSSDEFSKLVSSLQPDSLSDDFFAQREKIANKPWRYSTVLHALSDIPYINNIPSSYSFAIVGRMGSIGDEENAVSITSTSEISEISFPSNMLANLKIEELLAFRKLAEPFRVALREKDVKRIQESAKQLSDELQTLLFTSNERPLVNLVGSQRIEATSVKSEVEIVQGW
ncbi:hypothetical protein HK096_004251, partial [Nowakowskiella sp. JEL0078]